MRHRSWIAILLALICFSSTAAAQPYELTGATWKRSDGFEVKFVPAGDGYDTIIVTLQPGTGNLFKVGESIGRVGKVSGKSFSGTGMFRNGQTETRPEYTATFESANVFTTTFGERYTRNPQLPEAGAAKGLELEGTWRRGADGHVVTFTRAGQGYMGTIVDPAGVAPLFKAGEKTFELTRTSANTFDGKILFRTPGSREEWRPDKITMQDADHFTDVGGAWVRVGANPAQAGALELEGTWRRTTDGLVLRIDKAGNGYTGTIVDPVGFVGLFNAGEKTLDVARTSANAFAGKSEHRWSGGRSEWHPETITMQDADHFTDIRNATWVRVGAKPAGGASHCEKTLGKTWDPTTWGKLVITVNGNQASGTYTSRYLRLSGGTFTGTVSGNTLQGNWRDNDGEGTITLTLSDDGCTFIGKHTVTRGTGAGSAGTPNAADPGGRDAGMAGAGGLVDGLPADVCMDPEAQKCIQKWMDQMIEIRNRRDKSPQGQGGPWRFSEYGTLLGHSVIAAYAPDGWETKYKRNKYCVVWEIWQQAHNDPLHGNELPALRDSVRSCYAMSARPNTSVATPSGSTPGGSTPGGTTPGASAPGTGATAPGQPPAVSAMTLYAESRRVPAGEQVSIPVWLLRGADVANTNLIVRYDPAVVRVDGDIGKGNLLGDALFSANAGETALVRLGFAQRSGINGSGTVAVLPLRATGAAGTRSAITIEVSAINNASGATPRVELIHGEVLIVGADGMLPGDSDGDGRVTELDALLALKMSVKLIEERPTLDLDADRQVTSRDSVLILQRAVQPR